MSTTKRSMAALLAVMMLFIVGCSKSDSSAKKTTSSDSAVASDTADSSDTADTADTSDTADTADTAFTDDSALSDDTGSSDSGSSSEFCSAVADIKTVSAKFDTANTNKDAQGKKDAVAEGATVFENIAATAPSELQSDAEFVAQAWTDYSAALDASTTDDPATDPNLQAAVTKFTADATASDEVKALDAYISKNCA